MTENTEKKRILIVDDETSNLHVLYHILRRDYTVYMAQDGRTGLDIAGEFIPDLILLDIILPVMTGYEVIGQLKSMENCKHIPVIFISGLAESGSMEKGLASGASDYIFKPINAAEVLEKVQKQFTLSGCY